MIGRRIFGWSLPPGVTRLPGEEPEGPCAVCCKPVDDCICPMCPACGQQGDPCCYVGGPGRALATGSPGRASGGQGQGRKARAAGVVPGSPGKPATGRRRAATGGPAKAASDHGMRLSREQHVARQAARVFVLAERLQEERAMLEQMETDPEMELGELDCSPDPFA